MRHPGDFSEFENEIQKIKNRYEKRKYIPEQRYSMLAPQTYLVLQELEKKIIKVLVRFNLTQVKEKKLLEIGCGFGKNLLQFIKLGFDPGNLVGNDLLIERIDSAREILPAKLTLIEGDALKLNFKNEVFDIVYQSMVFSSILDNNFQKKLAEKMWSWVKPGGGILWYDFSFNNPKNRDVRGVKYSDIVELFPEGKIFKYRVSLAPPLARSVVKLHPLLYSLLNIFPFLKTHWLCWIQK